jgi:hypothetical protein
MSIIDALSALKAEQQQLESRIKQLSAAIVSLGGVSKRSGRGNRKGNMSAAGRARIAAAQRARWAKVKATKKK